MPDELADLLDAAQYKEIASQALYIAGQSRTEDPGAKALMRELADEELRHSEWIKGLRENELETLSWDEEQVADLTISEYLTGSDTLEGASLQDTISFAMKREQQAVEFYLKMRRIIKEDVARRLCKRLANAELKHKQRLETFYDDFFYGDD